MLNVPVKNSARIIPSQSAARYNSGDSLEKILPSAENIIELTPELSKLREEFLVSKNWFLLEPGY